MTEDKKIYVCIQQCLATKEGRHQKLYGKGYRDHCMKRIGHTGPHVTSLGDTWRTEKA